MQAEAEDREPEGSFADEVIDDLLPEGFDWRAMVCSYPVPALAISAACGYVLGRRHGTAILEALGDFASSEVDRNISSFLGHDAGDSTDGDGDG